MVENRTTLWKKFCAIRLQAVVTKCRRWQKMSSDDVRGYWTRTKCCISSQHVLKPCSFFVLHAFPLSPPIQCWKCCFEFFGEELRWAQASWQQRLQHWILGARGLSKSDATFCPSPVYPIVICRNAIKACTLKFYVRHNCSTPQKTTSFLHLGRWMVSMVGCSKNMFKKAQLQKRHELFSHRWVIFMTALLEVINFRSFSVRFPLRFPFVFRYGFHW